MPHWPGFWAFNNGVTILTKGFSTKKKGAVVATGVSVINGAQTTGVLGNAPREQAAACRLPCRFIKCGDPTLVDEIIENNNTQNAIKAFDIRSNDAVQRRLQTEFSSVDIVYLHRRQGAQRLSASAIQAEALAPFLAAFHGNFKSQFANEGRFSKIVRRMTKSSRSKLLHSTYCLFSHYGLRTALFKTTHRLLSNPAITPPATAFLAMKIRRSSLK